mmetsp:Transcript_3165/g.4728  ORF Transcript_3165/g.4728 Transcript_3165/m.4728 type:complete len:142 (-) Transcript_3165:1004-1429(-)|eukprot:CAMPEP_0172428172 /NCGR_PEP_ID=MMETSP1064-20121228/45316_1 /TAXON_ID=202472 /ORGANISM="Aulacoseira subarctica , Strain CCAP 1002/5" /LENGTH=141 /DNA_ID=CAMNT_0013172807 /DNA_START=92 /DNA_END=517 /DNA_ORIENTATION=-
MEDPTKISTDKDSSKSVEETTSAADVTESDFVVKDGKRFKKRKTFPPLKEMLMFGAPDAKPAKNSFQNYLFGPILLGVLFCLSFVCYYHVIKRLPSPPPSVGIGLMGRIDAARDHSNMQMKAQIERAKDISGRRNEGNGDL